MGERIAVDVHLALSWRRVEYVDSDALMSASVTREFAGRPVPVPSPEHELAVIAAHSLFKHNQISMFDVLNAADVRERSEVNDGTLRRIAAEANWGSQLDRVQSTADGVLANLIASGDGLDPLSLPEEFSLPTAANIRGRKLLADAREGRIGAVGVDSFAYGMDLTQLTIEDRLGISMRPFFDLLSWLKRRGRS